MDPIDWLGRSRKRPEFQDEALALRSNEQELTRYLSSYFHLEMLPEVLRVTILERLKQTVFEYDVSREVFLYQTCLRELQEEFYRSLWAGKAIPEWSNLFRFPPDFSEAALNLRSDEPALAAYLAEVFNEVLRCVPEDIRPRVMRRLHAVVLEFEPLGQGSLLPNCLQAVVAELAPESLAEELRSGIHLATETKTLDVPDS